MCMYVCIPSIHPSIHTSDGRPVSMYVCMDGCMDVCMDVWMDGSKFPEIWGRNLNCNSLYENDDLGSFLELSWGTPHNCPPDHGKGFVVGCSPMAGP